MSQAPPPFDPYRDWLGITAPERPVDYYTLLGLPRFLEDARPIAASAEQRLAAIYPLANGPYAAYAVPLLSELTKARSTLLDPSVKRQYDVALRNHLFGNRPAVEAPPLADAAMLLPPPARSNTPAPPPEEDVADEPAWHEQTWVRAAAAIGVMLLVVGGWIAAHSFFSGPPAQIAANEPPAETETETPAEPPAEDPPAPEPDVVLRQEGSGELNFTPAVGRINGSAERVVSGTETLFGKWDSTQTQFEWKFVVTKPDVFKLELIYAATEDQAGGKITAEIESECREFDLRPSAAPGKFVTDVKFVPITRSGAHRLVVYASHKPATEVAILKGLRLVPTKQSER